MSLVSKLGKTVAYSLVGVLPEQDFFSRQLNRWGEWYNPYAATTVSAIPEFVLGLYVGVEYSVFNPDETGDPYIFLGGLGLSILAGLRGTSTSIPHLPLYVKHIDVESLNITKIDEIDQKGGLFDRMFGKRGSWPLELIWGTGKHIGKYIGKTINYTIDRVYSGDNRTIKIEKSGL
ncbi:MAG: hypothetical protein IH843_05820 [Thaumarchaeota archaeon]|nr:hypothetical protein [Nitrososphaerota archaeon]